MKTEPDSPTTDPGAGSGRRLQTGELLLGCGIVWVALAMAMTHFVMGIYLASIPAAVGLSCTLLGVMRARGSVRPAADRALGMLLLLVGLAVLLVPAFASSSMSYQLALHWQRPTFPIPGPRLWLQLILLWLLPIVFIAPGLNLWTDWSRRRRRGWSIAFGAVSPATIAAHQVLAAAGGPLTA